MRRFPLLVREDLPRVSYRPGGVRSALRPGRSGEDLHRPGAWPSSLPPGLLGAVHERAHAHLPSGLALHHRGRAGPLARGKVNSRETHLAPDRPQITLLVKMLRLARITAMDCPSRSGSGTCPCCISLFPGGTSSQSSAWRPRSPTTGKQEPSIAKATLGLAKKHTDKGRPVPTEWCPGDGSTGGAAGVSLCGERSRARNHGTMFLGGITLSPRRPGLPRSRGGHRPGPPCSGRHRRGGRGRDPGRRCRRLLLGGGLSRWVRGHVGD